MAANMLLRRIGRSTCLRKTPPNFSEMCWPRSEQLKARPAMAAYACRHCSYVHQTTNNRNSTTNTTGPKASDLVQRLQKFTTSAAVEYVEEDDTSKDIVEKINSQVSNQEVGRLFAVVHVAGKQRKITEEDIIVLDKNIAAGIGEKIRLNKVLLVGSRDFTILGRPVLSPDLVQVEATVIEKTLDVTKVVFWYVRRKNIRHFHLHKQPLTFLRINNIELREPEA